MPEEPASCLRRGGLKRAGFRVEGRVVYPLVDRVQRLVLGAEEVPGADFGMEPGVFHHLQHLHFQAAENHGDAVFPQPLDQVTDHFLARTVDFVDRIAHHQDVLGLGMARRGLEGGVGVLLRRGVGGRPLREQQGSLWEIGDAVTQVEAAEALVANAAFRRDSTTSRESKGTTMARQISQDAAEKACLAVADLMGLRGLSAGDPWTRLLAEVRALRLETEFLENARQVVALSFIAAVEAEQKKA